MSSTPKNGTTKQTIFDIFRKHIIIIATALTQLMIISDISLSRLFIMLFSPIVNIIIDITEYINKNKTTPTIDIVQLIPNHYRRLNVSSLIKYGTYENVLYRDLSEYINYIIRNNKNTMSTTIMEINLLTNELFDDINNTNNNTNNNHNTGCITLANYEYISFYFNKTHGINAYTDTKHNTSNDIIYIQRIDSNTESINGSINTLYQYIIYGSSKMIVEYFISVCTTYTAELKQKKSSYHLYSYNSTIRSPNTNWDKYNITLRKNFSNIFLSKTMETFIPTHINHFINNEKDYAIKGQSYKTAFLFSGTPGCGKSSIAYAIANEYRRDIYRIDPEFFDNNDFSQRFRNIVNSIILIEEIDTIPLFRKRNKSDNIQYDSDYDNDSDIDHDSAYYIGNKLPPTTNNNMSGMGGTNGANGMNGINTNSVNIIDNKKSILQTSREEDRLFKLQKMLDILDGYCFLSGCIVIATTNHIDEIDPAFIRPGRIDHHFKFTHSDSYQIRNILTYFYKSWIPSDYIIEKLTNDKITPSYLINTLIMPNQSNPYNALLYHSHTYSWVTTDILQTIPHTI